MNIEIKEELVPETSFKLVDDFCDELVMIQVLPRLHNSHDRGFDLVATIFIDLRPRLLRFYFIFALQMIERLSRKMSAYRFSCGKNLDFVKF